MTESKRVGGWRRRVSCIPTATLLAVPALRASAVELTATCEQGTVCYLRNSNPKCERSDWCIRRDLEGVVTSNPLSCFVVTHVVQARLI